MKRPNRGEWRTARATRDLATVALAATVSLVTGCSWMPTWLGGTPSKASLAAPLTEFKPTLTPRVAWRANERLEIAVKGFNLLNEMHLEYPEPAGQGIRRSVMAELRYNY